MHEFVGVLLIDHETARTASQSAAERLFFDSPRTRDSIAIAATLPRQASCFRASWVVADSRFSFPTMRSTTLSV